MTFPYLYVCGVKLQIDSLPNVRDVVWVGGEELKVALVPGGGHIAALQMCDQSPTFEPLWQPSWKSLEPGKIDDDLWDQHYGARPEGPLLASILGHSLVLDLYGAPSPEETQAGNVTHGRIGVSNWEWRSDGKEVAFGHCTDESSQLQVSRCIHVKGFCVSVEERLRNPCSWDRIIGWQQYVSLGSPFCEAGFWARANCARGLTHPEEFGQGTSLIQNRETARPKAPCRDGRGFDYTLPLKSDAIANDFTGFEVEPSDELGHFVAGNTEARIALFYVWPRFFFPVARSMGQKTRAHDKALGGSCLCTGIRIWCLSFSVIAAAISCSPSLYGSPTSAILPARSELWVKYALGVFSDIATPGDFEVTKKAAVLKNKGKEVGRVPFTEGSMLLFVWRCKPHENHRSSSHYSLHAA